MSWWLTRAGVDHVVLERGAIAQSWRTRRWHSLRLLTPNWMTRLPGYGYDGDDPDGYQRAGEVVALLDAYGRAFGAPVRPHTTVVGVAAHGIGVPGGHRRRPVALPGRRRGDRDGGRVESARPRPRPARPPPTDHRAGLPRARAGRAGRGAGRGRLRVGRADRRRAAASRAAGDRRRRRPRPGAADLPRPRHLPLDATSWASSTSATTRSRTWSGPGGCRRCSWWARRSGARWIWPRCPRRALQLTGPLRRGGPRPRPVLRVAGQPDQGGRSQAGPAAGPHRRPRRRTRPAGPGRAARPAVRRHRYPRW